MNILLDPNARPVVAHRGGALHAPENTIEAMDLALANGAEGIECDVRITADGHVVVFHDPFTHRTAGRPGFISRMTLAEVRTLDVSARKIRPATWSSAIDATCRVPLLRDVLARFRSMPFIIEIKNASASRAARAIIEDIGAEERCLVASFSHGALAPFRGSRIPLGATRRDMIGFLGAALVRHERPWKKFDAFFMPPDYHGVPLPMKLLLAAARKAGKNTHIWTINEKAQAFHLWDLGARGMVTDDVPGMLAVRSAFRG